RGRASQGEPDVRPQLARPAVAVIEAEPADAAILRGFGPGCAGHGLARARRAAYQRHPVPGRGLRDQACDTRALDQRPVRPRHTDLVAGTRRAPLGVALTPARPSSASVILWCRADSRSADRARHESPAGLARQFSPSGPPSRRTNVLFSPTATVPARCAH